VLLLAALFAKTPFAKTKTVASAALKLPMDLDPEIGGPAAFPPSELAPGLTSRVKASDTTG
jgi:hypothetical protein